MASSVVFEELYCKYKDYTMLGPDGYMANLALTSTVTAPGCVIECGVWKGGTCARMAEILGPDRDYSCSIAFRGMSIHSRSTDRLHLLAG